MGAGRTDDTTTPSGSPGSNVTGTHACKYRGIENPYGNTSTFCDGISFHEEMIYFCADPTAYESGKITAPYFYMGDRPDDDGYAKVIAPFDKNPLLQFTKETEASDTTYYSDNYYTNIEDGKILLCGGSWGYGPSAGLWFWDGSDDISVERRDGGSRLCFKPL